MQGKRRRGEGGRAHETLPPRNNPGRYSIGRETPIAEIDRQTVLSGGGSFLTLAHQPQQNRSGHVD